jgi:hypothetical protein
MGRKTYLAILALAFLGGLFGGAVSGRLFSREPEALSPESGARRVIVAQEFHLVDQDGKERWVLALSRAGEPNITFINKDGWAPMALGMNEEGLPFFNMVLEPDKRGGPSMVLMDSAMRDRAHLGLARDGEPSLTLLDASGRSRAVLGRAEIRNPFTGSMEKRPVSSLVLMDEEGTVTWAEPRQGMMKQARAEPGPTFP